MTADASSEVRFRVRAMRADDEAFLYSAFLRWYRDSDHTDGIPNEAMFATFKQQWSMVLIYFSVLVAHPEGDEAEIAGFIAWHPKTNTVAFVYVKKDPWRRLGVATMLLREAGITKADTVWALYASSRSLALARSKGWRVNLVPATQAIRLLLGVA